MLEVLDLRRMPLKRNQHLERRKRRPKSPKRKRPKRRTQIGMNYSLNLL
jgi:hypothetical protein